MEIEFSDYQLSVKFVFCPKCGKADQIENSYCCHRGFFLPEIGKRQRCGIGGNTPKEQITTNLF